MHILRRWIITFPMHGTLTPMRCFGSSPILLFVVTIIAIIMIVSVAISLSISIFSLSTKSSVVAMKIAIPFIVTTTFVMAFLVSISENLLMVLKPRREKIIIVCQKTTKIIFRINRFMSYKNSKTKSSKAYIKNLDASLKNVRTALYKETL